MATPTLQRTVLAGLAGGLAFSLAMLLTFRLIGFGLNGDGILMTSPLQSAKLIAVWSTLEPLPRVVDRPETIIPLLVLLSVGRAFVFRWLAPAWPAGVAARGLRFAGLTFFLVFVFWEIFTPYNQFGEPPALVALELLFWAVIAVAEGLAIAAVIERAPRQA